MDEFMRSRPSSTHYTTELQDNNLALTGQKGLHPRRHTSYTNRSAHVGIYILTHHSIQAVQLRLNICSDITNMVVEVLVVETYYHKEATLYKQIDYGHEEAIIRN